MLDSLKYIEKEYELDFSQPSPFRIPFNRLTDLPILLRDLEVKSGAEIGVLDGKFSEILSRELPDATIYSIDKWAFYPLRNNFRKPWMYPAIYERAKERLSKYPNNKIIREWSLDAAKQFEDNSLDFVFIDADHRFEAVANDIATWIKKVKVGGIISGHDFEYATNPHLTYCHVRHVVEAWTAAHGVHPWFILDHNPERSWMWVKQAPWE